MCDEGFDSSDWDSGDVGDVSDYDVDDSFDDSDVDVEGGEPADFDYDDVDADVDIADDSVLDTYDVDVETDLDTTDEVDYDLEETADLDEANLSDVDLCADDAGEGEDFSDIADLMDEADSADIPAPLTVDDITDEMLEDYMVAEQEDLDDADDAGDGEDVKVLRRDPDELLEIGMRNVEDILDVRRDDMLDKGMAEDEIEEAIAKEREQLQQEFVQDAFPEEMENIEEPFDIENMEEEPEDLTDEEPVTEQLEEDIADTELADEEDLPEPSEEFDNGMDTAEETNEYDSEENLDAAAEDEVTDVIEHEEMPLDAFEETEDMAEEELDLLAAQLTCKEKVQIWTCQIKWRSLGKRKKKTTPIWATKSRTAGGEAWLTKTCRQTACRRPKANGRIRNAWGTANGNWMMTLKFSGATVEKRTL